MSRRFERMVIAGVGLIGGSLALAARKANLAREIVGLGRTQANLDVALARSIVDRATRDPLEAARGADLVVLAVPVGAMRALVRAMAPALAAGAIVTDVGSVKVRVLREVTAALPAGVDFVGAHPIAGTEASGAAAAVDDLFVGTRCILTPVAKTNAAALAAIRSLWEGAGAEVVTLAPERHDEILAWVSHVPHLLAFSLMRSCPPEAEEYAGPSFRDATRVAASSVEMWRDIFLNNADAVESAAERWATALESLREAIRGGDIEAVAAFLGEAAARRRRFGGGGT